MKKGNSKKNSINIFYQFPIFHIQKTIFSIFNIFYICVETSWLLIRMIFFQIAQKKKCNDCFKCKEKVYRLISTIKT